MVAEVSYTKPQPSAWAGLVNYAEDLVIGQDLRTGVPPVVIDNIVREVATLDEDPLDANAYYGQGLAMRHLYRQLQMPGAKDVAIDHLRLNFEEEKLDANRLFCGPPSYRTADAILAAGLDSFNEPAYRAVQNLPQPERLVIDTLTVVSNLRRLDQPLFTLDDGASPRVVETIRKGRIAAGTIAINAIGGSVEVLRRAVAAKASVGSRFNPETINDLRFVRAAAQAARLHAEEFAEASLLDRLLVPNDQGNLIFDRSQLPDRPQLPPAEFRVLRIKHSKREKCPAVFVGRLMLIQDMLDIVWRAGKQTRPV